MNGGHFLPSGTGVVVVVVGVVVVVVETVVLVVVGVLTAKIKKIMSNNLLSRKTGLVIVFSKIKK